MQKATIEKFKSSFFQQKVTNFKQKWGFEGSQWGGPAEIQALANLLHVNIEEYTPDPSSSLKQLMHIHTTAPKKSKSNITITIIQDKPSPSELVTDTDDLATAYAKKLSLKEKQHAHHYRVKINFTQCIPDSLPLFCARQPEAEKEKNDIPDGDEKDEKINNSFSKDDDIVSSSSNEDDTPDEEDGAFGDKMDQRDDDFLAFIKSSYPQATPHQHDLLSQSMLSLESIFPTISEYSKFLMKLEKWIRKFKPPFFQLFDTLKLLEIENTLITKFNTTPLEKIPFSLARQYIQETLSKSPHFDQQEIQTYTQQCYQELSWQYNNSQSWIYQKLPQFFIQSTVKDKDLIPFTFECISQSKKNFSMNLMAIFTEKNSHPTLLKLLNNFIRFTISCSLIQDLPAKQIPAFQKKWEEIYNLIPSFEQKKRLLKVWKKALASNETTLSLFLFALAQSIAYDLAANEIVAFLEESLQEQNSFKNFVDRITQHIEENVYGIPKTLTQEKLIKIISKNASKKKLTPLDQPQQLSDWCQAIKHYRQKEPPMRPINNQKEQLLNHKNPYPKKIASWDKKDISTWVTKNRHRLKKKLTEKNKLQLITIIDQGIFLHDGYHARDSQLLALFAFIFQKENSKKGLIQEIQTGEGKSTLINMLAIFLALQGNSIDVITTSMELAFEEVKRKKELYALFQLSVAVAQELQKDDEEEVARIYKSDIVYSTPSNFQGDILFSFSKNRPEYIAYRKRNIAIVDEVDSMFLDQCEMSTRLTFPTPGSDLIRTVFATIWQKVNQIDQHIFNEDGKFYFYNEPIDKKDNQVLIPAGQKLENIRELIPDRISTIKKKSLENMQKIIKVLNTKEQVNYLEYHKKGFLLKMLKKEMELCPKEEIEKKKELEEKIRKLRKEIKLFSKKIEEKDFFVYVPKYLEKYVRQGLPAWINNAIEALYFYNKEEDYDIEKNKIVPIDHAHTGTLQHQSVWEKGLSFFLSIKEDLPLPEQGICTTYLSNVSFFKGYHRIYGLTGTLGSSKAQYFFETVYQVPCLQIPPHQKRSIPNYAKNPFNCKEIPAICENNKEKYYEAIVSTILSHLKIGRACLLINEYITHVNQLEKLFKKYLPHEKHHQVYLYTGQKKYSHYHIQPGDLVLATHIAGRGTDLRTSKKLEKQGGLHVCITCPLKNSRVFRQAVGRTGRSGNKGTFQFILLSEKGQDFKQLYAKQEYQEAEAIDKEIRKIDATCFKDDLFVKFSFLLNEIFLDENDFTDNCMKNIIEKCWLAFLRKNTREAESQKITLNQETLFAEFYKKVIDKEKKNSNQQTPPPTAKKYFKSLERPYPLWGTSIRDGVSELFGFWLCSMEEKFDEIEKPGVKQEIQNSFEKLLNDIKQNAKKGKILSNPFYYLLEGNFYRNIDEYSKAILFYDKAIELEPMFMGIAAYQKAYCLLRQVNDSWSNQKKLSKKAKKCLEDSGTLFFCYTIPMLDYLGSQVASQGTKCNINNQLAIEEALVKNLLQLTSKGIEEIVKSDYNGNIGPKNWISIEEYVDLLKSRQEKEEEIKEESEEKEEEKKEESEHKEEEEEEQKEEERKKYFFYKKAQNLFKNNGMTHFMMIEKVPPLPIYQCIGLGVMGCGQIVGGAYMLAASAGTSSQVSSTLIQEGVSDLFSSWNNRKNRNFSLSKHMVIKMAGIGGQCLGSALLGKGVLGNKKIAEGMTKSVLKKSTKEITRLVTKEILLKVGRHVVMDYSSQFINFYGNKLNHKVLASVGKNMRKELVDRIQANDTIQHAFFIQSFNPKCNWSSCFSLEGKQQIENMTCGLANKAYFFILNSIFSKEKGTGKKENTISKQALFTFMSSAQQQILSTESQEIATHEKSDQTNWTRSITALHALMGSEKKWVQGLALVSFGVNVAEISQCVYNIINGKNRFISQLERTIENKYKKDLEQYKIETNLTIQRISIKGKKKDDFPDAPFHKEEKEEEQSTDLPWWKKDPTAKWRLQKSEELAKYLAELYLYQVIEQTHRTILQPACNKVVQLGLDKAQAALIQWEENSRIKRKKEEEIKIKKEEEENLKKVKELINMPEGNPLTKQQFTKLIDGKKMTCFLKNDNNPDSTILYKVFDKQGNRIHVTDDPIEAHTIYVKEHGEKTPNKDQQAKGIEDSKDDQSQQQRKPLRNKPSDHLQDPELPMHIKIFSNLAYEKDYDPSSDDFASLMRNLAEKQQEPYPLNSLDLAKIKREQNFNALPDDQKIDFLITKHQEIQKKINAFRNKPSDYLQDPELPMHIKIFSNLAYEKAYDPSSDDFASWQSLSKNSYLMRNLAEKEQESYPLNSLNLLHENLPKIKREQNFNALNDDQKIDFLTTKHQEIPKKINAFRNKPSDHLQDLELPSLLAYEKAYDPSSDDFASWQSRSKNSYLMRNLAEKEQEPYPLNSLNLLHKNLAKIKREQNCNALNDDQKIDFFLKKKIKNPWDITQEDDVFFNIDTLYISSEDLDPLKKIFIFEAAGVKNQDLIRYNFYKIQKSLVALNQQYEERKAQLLPLEKTKKEIEDFQKEIDIILKKQKLNEKDKDLLFFYLGKLPKNNAKAKNQLKELNGKKKIFQFSRNKEEEEKEKILKNAIKQNDESIKKIYKYLKIPLYSYQEESVEKVDKANAEEYLKEEKIIKKESKKNGTLYAIETEHGELLYASLLEASFSILQKDPQKRLLLFNNKKDIEKEKIEKNIEGKDNEQVNAILEEEINKIEHCHSNKKYGLDDENRKIKTSAIKEVIKECLKKNEGLEKNIEGKYNEQFYAFLGEEIKIEKNESEKLLSLYRRAHSQYLFQESDEKCSWHVIPLSEQDKLIQESNKTLAHAQDPNQPLLQEGDKNDLLLLLQKLEKVKKYAKNFSKTNNEKIHESIRGVRTLLGKEGSPPPISFSDVGKSFLKGMRNNTADLWDFVKSTPGTIYNVVKKTPGTIYNVVKKTPGTIYKATKIIYKDGALIIPEIILFDVTMKAFAAVIKDPSLNPKDCFVKELKHKFKEQKKIYDLVNKKVEDFREYYHDQDAHLKAFHQYRAKETFKKQNEEAWKANNPQAHGLDKKQKIEKKIEIVGYCSMEVINYALGEGAQALFMYGTRLYEVSQVMHDLKEASASAKTIKTFGNIIKMEASLKKEEKLWQFVKRNRRIIERLGSGSTKKITRFVQVTNITEKTSEVVKFAEKITEFAIPKKTAFKVTQVPAKKIQKVTQVIASRSLSLFKNEIKLSERAICQLKNIATITCPLTKEAELLSFLQKNSGWALEIEKKGHFENLLSKMGLSGSDAVKELINKFKVPPPVVEGKTLTQLLQEVANVPKDPHQAIEYFKQRGFKNLEREYRKNLIKHTKEQGIDLLIHSDLEVHHIFPKKLAKEFAKIGINVHDPRLLAWVDKPTHLKLHNGQAYNAWWSKFLDTKPTLEKAMAELFKTVKKHSLCVPGLKK